MGIEYTAEEIRQNRERELAELPAKYNQTMEELHERFHHPIAYSEVMHPAFMLCETIESYMLTSPCVVFDEEAFRHAHDAQTALFNLYQRLGNLRYEAEDKDEGPLNLDGHRGAWAEIFFMLGSAPIGHSIKSSLARSLSYANQDDDIDPPQRQSFRQLLQFLASHPELPAPSLNCSATGLFTLSYRRTDDTAHVLIQFSGLDTAEVMHSIKTDDSFGVESNIQPADRIKLPEWLSE